MRIRNFWVSGRVGYRTPAGEFITEQKFMGGPRRIIGGLELEIFQRVSGESYGAQQILLAEGIAEENGRLVFRITDRDGRVVWRSVTHRDGVHK